MLGGVLFACYQGSNLDSNAKMWRLVADLMNDIGMLLDLLSPLFPSAFIFLVCFGSLSRSFTGVAGGATKAALTQHFALQNNAADIAAKEGSQETMATMIGMALGMLLARVTMGHPLSIWISFLSLTMFHMYANYRAVHCLSLASLNPERTSILLRHFLETGQEVSPVEHVLPFWINWSSKNVHSLHKNIHLGIQISSLDQVSMSKLIHAAGAHYRKEKYLLLETKGRISVIMHKQSTATDILKAFVHALVMANLKGKSDYLHLECQSWIDKHYETFLQKLKASGWKTERLLSYSVVWRANWMYDSSDAKIK